LAKQSNKDLANANQDIESPIRAWGRELIKSVSPPLDPKAPDDPGVQKQYVFRKFLYISITSLLCIAQDYKRNEKVVFKFCLPPAPDKQVKPKQKKKAKFIKAREYVMNVYKDKIARYRPHKNEDTERFRRGIQIQHQLHKKLKQKGLTELYVPEIYEWKDGTVGERHRLYCVMEFINGIPLIDWCKDRTDREVIEILYLIAKGLENIVHRFSVVHSDIKPANILVLNNRPVLLDFGISRLYQSQAANLTSPTTTGLGTPAYSSAEQLENPIARSFKDDIFALGRTFWAMWSREEPDLSDIIVEVDSEGREKYCEETTQEALRAKFPASIFPPEEREIFERAHHIDPEQRYSDISEMRRDIELLKLKKYRVDNNNFPQIAEIIGELIKIWSN